MTIKRLHYFDHQFLVEADFTDEQKYHLDMRRRLNRLLHTFGIAEGLAVAKSANKTVTVRPGMAIDRLGREMIVEADQVVDLSNAAQFPGSATVFITITYQEQETDPTTATGVSGNTRYTEQPTIQAVTTAPPTDGTVVQLARFTLDASANVPGNINDLFDGGARRTIGPRGEQGLASVDGVSNPGGNVDLVSANALTITPDDANNRITIGETHSARTDNPHATTAAQVGALPSGGGTVSGNLQVNGNIGVTGTVDGRDVSADGAALTAHVGVTNGNPHGTTAAQVGAMPASGGTIIGSLRVGPNGSTAILGNAGDAQNGFGMEAGKNQSVFISSNATPTVSGGPKTAMLIWPVSAGFQGLNIFASTGGVDTLSVAGTARFTGTKIGYVADTFVNASGGVLHTGDVVKLKATGHIRFHGDDNRIPIPEVIMSDSEDDPLVIGIVAQEATPASDEPDRRTEPEDPTSIPEGGELFVVTLGTFAHCRVDATAAPIAVGDLLTSSGNPGHARKATNPKIGSIIGKALEPLQEGTGYIAVFVNIQ